MFHRIFAIFEAVARERAHIYERCLTIRAEFRDDLTGRRRVLEAMPGEPRSGVVALFTLVLARAELTLQRMQRAQATQGSPLLESQRADEGLEWIRVQRQAIVDRAREEQLRRRSEESPDDLIEEAEE